VSPALIVINLNKLQNTCYACLITTKHNKQNNTSHEFPGGRTDLQWRSYVSAFYWMTALSIMLRHRLLFSNGLT